MTPERLEEMRKASFEKLQARHTRNNDIIRNMCVLLDEDDATLLGTHLVKITTENRTLRTENATLLRLLKWCVESTAGHASLEFDNPDYWGREENKANARELRRVLEGSAG